MYFLVNFWNLYSHPLPSPQERAPTSSWGLPKGGLTLFSLRGLGLQELPLRDLFGLSWGLQTLCPGAGQAVKVPLTSHPTPPQQPVRPLSTRPFRNVSAWTWRPPVWDKSALAVGTLLSSPLRSQIPEAWNSLIAWDLRPILGEHTYSRRCFRSQTAAGCCLEALPAWEDILAFLEQSSLSWQSHGYTSTGRDGIPASTCLLLQKLQPWSQWDRDSKDWGQRLWGQPSWVQTQIALQPRPRCFHALWLSFWKMMRLTVLHRVGKRI